MDLVLIGFMGFLILGSIVALEMRHLLSAVIAVGVVGLGLSILFLLLGAPDIAITQVVVGGTDGFWIEGDPHVVVLLDDDGTVIQDEARLAGSTLLFGRNGVTIRIEGDLDLGQALEIAARLS